ncbi:MAG: hypothetical protein WDN48_03035 [Pseudolabrys sp.]
MNKPLGLGTSTIEPAAPAVVLPKAPPTAPVVRRSRKTWLIGGLALNYERFERLGQTSAISKDSVDNAHGNYD